LRKIEEYRRFNEECEKERDKIKRRAEEEVYYLREEIKKGHTEMEIKMNEIIVENERKLQEYDNRLEEERKRYKEAEEKANERRREEDQRWEKLKEKVKELERSSPVKSMENNNMEGIVTNSNEIKGGSGDFLDILSEVGRILSFIRDMFSLVGKIKEICIIM
jgi:DNA repair exonuclease SbcCD ATPase subunit